MDSRRPLDPHTAYIDTSGHWFWLEALGFWCRAPADGDIRKALKHQGPAVVVTREEPSGVYIGTEPPAAPFRRGF